MPTRKTTKKKTKRQQKHKRKHKNIFCGKKLNKGMPAG